MPPRLVLHRGSDVSSSPAVTAALLDVERVSPAAGAVLRAEIDRLTVENRDLSSNRVDIFLARMLTEAGTRSAASSSDAAAAAREARAVTDQLGPLVARFVSIDADERTEHAREGELELARLKSREKIVLGMIPVLLALTSLLTWWVTDGRGVSPPPAPQIENHTQDEDPP